MGLDREQASRLAGKLREEITSLNSSEDSEAIHIDIKTEPNQLIVKTDMSGAPGILGNTYNLQGKKATIIKPLGSTPKKSEGIYAYRIDVSS